MIVKIRVITNAKQEKLEEIGENLLKVHLREKPEKGKANKALIDFLSDELDIPRANVTILSGHTSSEKLVEILN